MIKSGACIWKGRGFVNVAVLYLKRLRFLTSSWACSSVGRAPGLQPGGQGFESPQVHQPTSNISVDYGPRGRTGFGNLSPFGSKNQPFYTLHRPALVIWDRVEINLPCDLRRRMAEQSLYVPSGAPAASSSVAWQ